MSNVTNDNSLPKFSVKWNGTEYVIEDLDKTNSVYDLKNKIQSFTNVLIGRQKLLGLIYKGKPASDDVLLGEIKIKPNAKIMMMGTCEKVIAIAQEIPNDLPEVLLDFDMADEEIVPIENREEFITKINRRVKDYKIDIINKPRPGKKLLVLDIDYTIFDHRSTAERGSELMRPYLHEFLASAYVDYDIAIWSATGMKWIKVKMEELRMINNDNFKLSFLVDSAAMISINVNQKYGFVRVKPLAVIWGIFGEHVYSAKNTIMFDDIRHNFLMNPQTGLRIKAFRKAHVNRDTDDELLKLAIYLQKIAKLADFTELNHREWKYYDESEKLDSKRQKRE